MLQNPTVSIIIPTYNREKLLSRAIKSIQQQTYTDWELIVVDDDSTDGTEEEIMKIKDSRIRYVKNDENIGAAGSRNHGVSLAKGDYIAFQDSDDVWRPDKLGKQMRYLCAKDGYDMVYCSFLRHYLDGRDLVVPNQQVGDREGWIFNTILVNNVIGTPTILIRRDKFWEYGGFDTTLRALEDWDFVLRVSKNCRIGFLPEILVDAYQTAGSISYDGAGYFEARCKMITSNVEYLQEIGLFDKLVLDVFHRAEQRGVLESVEKIFMLSLKKYYKK